MDASFPILLGSDLASGCRSGSDRSREECSLFLSSNRNDSSNSDKFRNAILVICPFSLSNAWSWVETSNDNRLQLYRMSIITRHVRTE